MVEAIGTVSPGKVDEWSKEGVEKAARGLFADAPDWSIGLVAPAGISMATESHLFGTASQGFMFVADGGPR